MGTMNDNRPSTRARLRRFWVCLSLAAIGMAAGGCQGDPKGSGLTQLIEAGAACSSDTECRSGLCVDAVCVAPNVVPQANAGANRVTIAKLPVSVDGSASLDPDNADATALTYAWSLVSSPAGGSGTFSAADTVAPTFQGDTPGVYTLELRVTDTDGATDTDGVGVFVLDADGSFKVAAGGPCSDGVQCASGKCVDGVCGSNFAPTADAGASRTEALGDTVTLDGSGSVDSDGDPLSYAWELVITPEGSTTVLTASDASSTDLQLDVPGLYVARLRVNDGYLGSGPATVGIYASTGVADLRADGEPCDKDEECESQFCFDATCKTNEAPTAIAGKAVIVQVGTTVDIDGGESSDPEGAPLNYAWAVNEAPDGSTAAVNDPTATATTFIPDLPGVYVLRLVVDDGTLPSLPEDLAIYADTEPVNLLPDGEPCTLGLQCQNAFCDVNACATNIAPVANAGLPQEVLAGDVVTLDGSASSDPEGYAIDWQWTLVSAPAGSDAALDDPSLSAPSFTADAVGLYQFSLVVNDGQVDSVPAFVAIGAVPIDGLLPNGQPCADHSECQSAYCDPISVVCQVNLPPTADIVGPTAGETGSELVLDGSASSDPESAALSYVWTLDTVPASSASVLAGGDTNMETLTPDLPGVYVITLQVDDGTSASATAFHVVEVTAAANNLPDGDPCTDDIECASGFCGPDGTCACLADTCSSLGAACGSPSNGCGDTLDCGGCGAVDTCDQSTFTCDCVPLDCTALGADCGAPHDGCGNPLDCGTCPVVTNGSGTCNAGTCEATCDPGFRDCGGQCVDDTDPASCGTSCTPCLEPPSGEGAATCNTGTCGTSCNLGYDPCNGDCIDPLTDVANCGGCGVDACAFACVDGVCENPYIITVISGDGQVVGPNQVAPALLRLRVTDQALTPQGSLPLDVVAADGGWHGSATTDAAGEAVIEIWSGRALGDYIFEVSAAPLSNTVVATLTAQAYADGTVFPLTNHGQVNSVSYADGPGSHVLMRHAGSGGLAVAGDNTLYFTSVNSHEILALSPAGQATKVGGTGSSGGGGDFGPALSATFNTPNGVGLDEALGRLYVADRGNRRIRYIDLDDGNVYPFAGGGANTVTDGDGGSATGAYLPNSRDVRVGPDGNVYLVDDDRIRRIVVANGAIEHFVGSAFDGCGGEATIDNCGSSNQFGCGMAWAPDGTMYVAGFICGGGQAAASGVLRIGTDGSRRRVAGYAAGSTADGVGALLHLFRGPARDVALDPAGNLYVLVSDSNSGGESVIIRIDARTTLVETIAGDAYGGVGNYGPATDARFDRPSMMAMSPSGHLVLFDHFNFSMRAIWNPGTTVPTAVSLVKVGGDGSAAVVNDAFQVPLAVQVQDGTGTAIGGLQVEWTADQPSIVPQFQVAVTSAPGDESSIGGRVGMTVAAEYTWQARFRDIDGNDIPGSPATFTVTATAPSNGDMFPLINQAKTGGVFNPGPASIASINRPFGVAAGSDGTVYVASSENHTVVAISPDGAAYRLAGTGSAAFTGDNGPGDQAQLNAPHDVAVDDTDNLLYIVDRSNDAIRVVDLDTGIISLFAGRGTQTSPPYGDGGPALDATFGSPVSVAVSPDGARVFVTDERANIRVIENGVIDMLFQGGTCNVNPVVMLAQASGGCNGFACTAQMDDFTGDLYVSGRFCGTAWPSGGTNIDGIIRFPGGFGPPVPVAGAWSVVGNVGDGDDPLDTTFVGIKGIAIDAAGNILLTEPNNHTVRMISATTGLVETIVGTGIPGPGADYVPALTGQINRGAMLGMHPDGHLMVAEENGDSVRLMWRSCTSDADCGTTGQCNLLVGGCVLP